MTNDLSRSKRLAVLIDADNTSARITDGLFEEIAKLGEATVRRLYGDFSSDRMKGWSAVLSKHAITEHQQRSYTSGKNASDIALVIDAMDLLHSGRFEGFCLVSSDSDFTRLASRLREEGVDVYGFGEKKTPESFRQACKRFIYTENLTPASSDKSKKKTSRKTPKAAIDIISKAIAQLDQDDGWVTLSAVGKQISQLAPDFDPRTYGFSKLSDLVKNCGVFELEAIEGKHLQVRHKG
jgi:uncharacterized LabA/DUF88 family protein